MSAIEKLLVQIFEKKNRIIDQARRQCHLFDQHLVSKLLIDGIVPPPWLTNPVLPSLASDPKDLNEDDLIFEALFSRPHCTIPFSGRQRRLQGDLIATADDGQARSGLYSEFHALKKDSDAGDGLSNLPDCSVNNVGRCSTSAPEMYSVAISPQIEMESRMSENCNDPAVSLAKLQRSKSRQRALELRHSAKAAKSCSEDGNNAGVCAGRISGCATSSLQLDHIEGSDLVKAFDTNIQSCASEEAKRGERLAQENDQSNYSGRITRFKSLAQKLNSLNVVSSSVVKEDGPESNNGIEHLEPVDPLCFTNRSCAKEIDKGDYQRRETESNVYSKRLTRSKSTSQAKSDEKLLKLDTTLVKGNEVEFHDSVQPSANVESTFLSKDGDCCSDKQESNDHRRLPVSLCQSCNEDFSMTGGSLMSICKASQSPQPSVSQHSQVLVVPVVGSFRSQKDPDLCAAKAREVKSIEKISKSNKSQNLRGTKMTAGRSSSTNRGSKLDTDVAMNFGKVAAVAASRNSRAVTTCTTEGSLRPMNSSNLEGRYSSHTLSTSNKPSLVKLLHVETVVAEKSLDTKENVISHANDTNKFDDRSAATAAKVDADCDVLVEKYNACLVSSPKVRLDVSFSMPPSDFVMSVKPKQLDFDDVEELSLKGNSSSDLKEGGQDGPPEREALTMLEPGYLIDKVTSLVCQKKCDFSADMRLLERQEVLIREDGPQLKSCESQFEEEDAERKALDVMSSKSVLSVVQKELCTNAYMECQELPIEASSPMNHIIPSQDACENSSGSFPNEAMASKFVSENSYMEHDECSSKILENAFSAAVTGNDQLGNAVQTDADLPVGSPCAAMDESNIALTHLVLSSGLCLHQNNNLSRGKRLSDGKDAGCLSEFQISKNSRGSLASDMDHSCPQHKRRKIESQAQGVLAVSPSLLEKPPESVNHRLVSENLTIEEDNREATLEVQDLTSHHEVTENPNESRGCHITEGSSLEVRPDQVFNKDGKNKSGNNLLTFTSNELGESFVSCLTEQGSCNSHYCLAEQMVGANSSGFSIGSTRTCTMDKNLDSWHAERSNSRKRIYPGGNVKPSEGSSVSRGIQSSDLIGADENIPEIEGFIIQPDEARPCTGEDQIELEKLNFSSDTNEYASFLEHLGKSTFMHSPLCCFSTPYRLHKIPDLYQSLPNGLVEGMTGMRTSLPLNGERGKSFSDCLPNCKDQSTWDIKKKSVSPIQTLWDRINSKYGSSGKRESSKPELPCIDEENEAADEIANTFQGGIGPEVTTSSTKREPLAEITDNGNPSLVSQDNILAERRDLDSVTREFSFSGTQNQVKQKHEIDDVGRRRFTGKGKENVNQSISRGANRAKRTTESVSNRFSRPKLSGKNSMNKGPIFSGGKPTSNNIVSNITSFVPLVQQKQAAEVIPGKRDIKVKALEAAEAAKRIAEKKENERKMKKEALRLERDRLEQNNLKQLELQNRKKEEERKKKGAEMAAKKRQREEEERKEKERKKKRVDEAKRKHQEHEEKLCAKKGEKEAKCRAAGDGKHESKECIGGRENCKNSENNRESNTKIPLSETLTIKNPATDEMKESFFRHSEAANDCGKTEKVIGNTIRATKDDDSIVQNIMQEPSYDISPYKESDDEDEDEDDNRNDSKFVPLWASKHRLSLAVSSQKLVDPETIFPLQSFCNISEVLLPRKLQVK